MGDTANSAKIPCKNIVLLICDSLRFDYAQYLGLDAKIRKAIAPGTHTPVSIPAILAGRITNIESFLPLRRVKGTTLLDEFENSEYYDHPYDPMRKILGFKLGDKPKELLEMEEPFLWVERLDETHLPYGEIRHGNEFPRLARPLGLTQRIRETILLLILILKSYGWWIRRFREAGFNPIKYITALVEREKQILMFGMEEGLKGEKIFYIEKLKRRGLDIYEEYIKGVKALAEHIRMHLEEIKKLKLETQVIITSDHGEVLDPNVPYSHGGSETPVEVPLIMMPDIQVEEPFELLKLRKLIREIR